MHQACTSDHNPTGNADTERAMRPRKEACLGLQEWTCPFALSRTLGGWLDDDNAHDLHAALGDKTPRPCAQAYHRSHSSPFVAA
jgi:hypothetical protein